MKDEIKEILRNCEKVINEASGYNDTTDKIIDYITNLQEENKELNRMCEIYSKSLYNADLTKAEKRIDKAVDFTNRTIEVIKQQPTEDDSWILDRLNGFKYILNGDDE